MKPKETVTRTFHEQEMERQRNMHRNAINEQHNKFIDLDRKMDVRVSAHRIAAALESIAESLELGYGVHGYEGPNLATELVNGLASIEEHLAGESTEEET